MIPILSRRHFIVGMSAFATWRSAANAQDIDELYGDEPSADDDYGFYDDESGYDPALLPPAESESDFPIEPVNMKKIPGEFHRQIVPYEGPEFPGTIVVDPAARYLYHVREGGEATRYGVGVGRAGFAWSGVAEVGLKRRWPRWVPPKEMVARDENAAKWANGQPGGPDNPLGARALYLYADNKDTLYRIHGTNDPSSIGKAKSSGCVRMLNQDIAELFLQVPLKTHVLVKPAGGGVLQADTLDEPQFGQGLY
ncbi:MAG: L,D-transpeptidase [Rhizobiales bacterium]|nr:L,D-transpeptidase [Hyphomicrobiales bacterium]